MAKIDHVFVIAIGLGIGSFLNVVIDRIPRQQSIIWPASHCPACGSNLSARDLVPVINYFLLRGSCRYCQHRIKLRCPLVEVLTPLSFWIVFLKTGISVETLAGWILSALLLAGACIDFEEGIIPDQITYPGIMMGLLIAWPTIGLHSAVQGSIIFSAFLLGVAFVTNGGMGGGDIKLAAVIGAFQGPGGAVMTLAMASILGGLWAALLLMQGKVTPKTAIRFGPFMAIAAMTVWIYRVELLELYIALCI